MLMFTTTRFTFMALARSAKKQQLKMTATQSFELEEAAIDDIHTFKLSGRLMDQAQSEELIEHLEKAIDEGKKKIILDLEGLNYMNSTGLNTVIAVMNKVKQGESSAVICNLNTTVQTLFMVTKLDSVYTIVKTHEEAVSKLNG